MININSTDIIISLGDITEIKTDAIVNAANNTLLGGGGVDGAIHKAGGKSILKECKEIGGCATGDAKITGAGDLFCKHIIHTVGPIYSGDKRNEVDLKRAYRNSLNLAKEYNIKKIAFPSISTGAYGYPIELASKIAIEEIINFVKQDSYFDEILFILHSENDYKIYEKNLRKFL